MLSSYAKTAWRNFIRNPVFSAINVFGLAVGIACCLLIVVFVAHETSYDTHHENSERIYRLAGGRGEPETLKMQATTPMPLGPTLAAEFPEVESFVRLRAFSEATPVSVNGSRFAESRFFFADSSVFDVFTIPLIRGSADEALSRPFTVVLSHSVATKYFGNLDPVGRTIVIDPFRNGGSEYEITAVFEDVPSQSHIHFDLLASFSSQTETAMDSWTWFPPLYTYILLDNVAGAEKLTAQFTEFVDRHVTAGLDAGEQFLLSADALTDIHLRSGRKFEVEPTSSATFVSVIALIGFFILVLACVNFINLATAKSIKRAREIGVRKVMGAHALQITRQILVEVAMIILIAVIAGFALAEILLPAFSDLVDRQLTLEHSEESIAVVSAFAIALTGVVGLYPSLILSRYRATEVLKGGMASHAGGIRLRGALVVFQFTVSTALIVCTATAMTQTSYLLEKSLGFERDQLMTIPLDSDAREASSELKTSFERIPGIDGATASLLVPGEEMWTWGVSVDSDSDGQTIGTYMVDHDFIDVYGLDLIAGRAFSAERPADRESAFIVNEAAVDMLGLGAPEDAVGAEMNWSGGERIGPIIGVVENFHTSSLHQPIEPLVMFVEPWVNFLTVRVESSDITGTLSRLEKAWSRVVPTETFTYEFLDRRFEALHRKDIRMTRTITLFALLAVLIACLGLFGLAAYLTEMKTKEIGVRKVLGATSAGVTAMLAGKFLKLVLLAFLIGAFPAWLAMESWLSGFAYRIEIGPSIFLGSALVASLVALLAVGFQALKAGRTNPVNSLRYD